MQPHLIKSPLVGPSSFRTTHHSLSHGTPFRRTFSSSLPNLSSSGLQKTGSPLAFSYSITSYFCLPEQGMESYDVLSRSSLFFVRSQQFWKRFHLFAPAHVTHPWLYKSFYPENLYPWLNFVHEKAVVNKLGIRKNETGELIQEFPLLTTSHRSKDHDFIVLHLEDEDGFESWITNKHNMNLNTVELSNKTIKPEDDVILVGNDLVQNESSGEEILVPTWTHGKVNVIKKQRVFVKTPEPVVMGMCGGPVLLPSSTDDASNQCVGIIEALVGPIPSNKKNSLNPNVLKEWLEIEGNAVHIDVKVLSSFLEGVEKSRSLPSEPDF